MNFAYNLSLLARDAQLWRGGGIRAIKHSETVCERNFYNTPQLSTHIPVISCCPCLCDVLLKEKTTPPFVHPLPVERKLIDNMAFSLNFVDRVLYSCSCAQFLPIGELFFCRHCKVARCPDCVATTLESFSCPHCFETASLGGGITSDLKLKRGRCNHCFQCPQCASALVIRSVIKPSDVLGEQSPQKQDVSQSKSPSTPPKVGKSPGVKSPGGTKLYFLTCAHCKWSSRDVGIKDQRSPIDFKDRVSPHQERIDNLISFYKDYAFHDNMEMEKSQKPLSGRRSSRFSSLLDTSRYSKLSGSADSPSSLRRGSLTWDPKRPELMAAKAVEDPKPPPEELYTTATDLNNVPTLEQQLRDPLSQPKLLKDLWPKQMLLTGKKLHRCKGCEHILIKAETNPGSIRFKIQQVALHSFPQVRILQFPQLVAGEANEVLLSISNPLNYSVTLSFKDCSADIMKRVKENLVAVFLPEGEFTLAPNDDVGDLIEDESESTDTADNAKFIHSHLPGKIVLKFSVTPEAVSENTNIIFVIRFDHRSTLESDKASEPHIMEVPVLVRLCKSVC